MKKVIILILLILPVVIVLITFAIANSLGREIMFAPVEHVVLSNIDGLIDEGYWIDGEPTDENLKLVLWADRYTGKPTARDCEPYELGKFFTVVPSKVKITDFKFTSSNEDAVTVKEGNIYILQKTRTSDKYNEVVITASFSGKDYFTVYVNTEDIPDDENRFDYFGWYKDNRVEITAELGVPFSLSAILEGGIDTSPHDLLYNIDEDRRNAFLASLKFTSSNQSILEVTEDGTIAEIMGEGEVIITISTDFRSSNHPPVSVTLLLTLQD